MYFRSLLVFLTACAPTGQPGGGSTGAGPDSAAPAEPAVTPPAAIAPVVETPPDVDPCTGLEGCVDADSLTVRWTTGPETGASRIVDAEGPGTYALYAGSSAAKETFVLSKPPFAVARSDFADATGSFVIYSSNDYHRPAGDLTGDGVTDYVRNGNNTEVVAGPLVGDIHAMPPVHEVPYADGTLSEWTGDGLYDRFISPGDAKAGAVVWTEVYPGPLPGWDAPARFRFEVEWPADATYECMALNMPLNFGPRDLDGDGKAEFLLGSGGLGSENSCPFDEMWVVPSDFVGTVRQTEDKPFPFARWSDGELIADQDGDGIQDTVFYAPDPVTGEIVRGLYSGPMAEKDGWWVPSGPYLLAMPPVAVTPLWEIDGDGIIEWLAGVAFPTDVVPATIATTRWAVYRGGVESLAALEPLGYWGTRHAWPMTSPFVLPEEKALFLPTADGLGIVDLSALEPQ